MATFHFDLVSPERITFSGAVDQVDIPGAEGDFGVLAGHAPVVAAIRPGILTVTTGSTVTKQKANHQTDLLFARTSGSSIAVTSRRGLGTTRPSSPRRKSG